ncbi:ABC transporter ATP-binding protein [Flavobacterium psychroterrae]|uniref:ABC transporter ATP-binding protein n=1 Tax=Flavobacterium psychroterrae TaxID=2133767 RepID=A0ABS5PCA7_9FLAO|nr:ABC transporter ATP-binding protein [Flavobacterium psychroterrae]MBS7231927.1 ABC transporter ATP-binding protein [Flavobacterium psychroterrae]
MTDSIFKNIKKLWQYIGKTRRLHFIFLIILMILASFAEILSIGAVFPFFGVLMDPNKILDVPFILPFLKTFNITATDQIIAAVTIFFCLAVILAGAMRIMSTWVSVRLSFALGRDLSNDIYKRTLYQPYSIHVSRNSSDVINGIWVKVSEVIFYILMPVFNLISSTILCITLVVTLLVVTPNVALMAIGGLIIVYGVIIKLTKEKLKINSVTIARESNNIIKNLQEGLSGIRDVLIDNSQENFCTTYNNTNSVLRRAQGTNQIIGQIPNFILVSLGMVLIAFVSYTLTISGGFAKAMPSLAALTLGLQRLLPNAQQLYAAWSTITGSQASLKDVIDLLEQPYPENIDEAVSLPVPFKRDITVNNVSFRYNENTPLILKNIDLKITKGARIGFIGTTGCGKSTLLDIVMGLLNPSEGNIKVDGQLITESNCRSWQAHIAHVPQIVFLADNTIESNIAFGIPTELIDKNRVRRAAEQAQLAEIIDSWPLKYDTRVGERGVQLSGGQCQRIGIARALYKEASLIILDEATSALDSKTEKEVLDSIENLSKDITILVIAHRLNTLGFCTEVIELDKGGIIKSSLNNILH